MSMDRVMEWELTVEIKVLGGNLFQYHFVQPEILRDRARDADVVSQRLTSWAMARHFRSVKSRPVGKCVDNLDQKISLEDTK
jgi:hypothetical protein